MVVSENFLFSLSLFFFLPSSSLPPVTRSFLFRIASLFPSNRPIVAHLESTSLHHRSFFSHLLPLIPNSKHHLAWLSPTRSALLHLYLVYCTSLPSTSMNGNDQSSIALRSIGDNKADSLSIAESTLPTSASTTELIPRKGKYIELSVRNEGMFGWGDKVVTGTDGNDIR